MVTVYFLPWERYLSVRALSPQNLSLATGILGGAAQHLNLYYSFVQSADVQTPCDLRDFVATKQNIGMGKR